MKQILFFGDSLTAGYRVKESEAVPHLIQQKIDAEGLAYQVPSTIFGVPTRRVSQPSGPLAGPLAFFYGHHIIIGFDDPVEGIDPVAEAGQLLGLYLSFQHRAKCSEQ